MATDHLFYTVSHRADGWHAGPVDRPSERVFSTKAEALGWCKAQAQQSARSAASTAVFDFAEVEIREQT